VLGSFISSELVGHFEKDEYMVERSFATAREGATRPIAAQTTSSAAGQIANPPFRPTDLPCLWIPIKLHSSVDAVIYNQPILALQEPHCQKIRTKM